MLSRLLQTSVNRKRALRGLLVLLPFDNTMILIDVTKTSERDPNFLKTSMLLTAALR